MTRRRQLIWPWIAAVVLQVPAGVGLGLVAQQANAATAIPMQPAGTQGRSVGTTPQPLPWQAEHYRLGPGDALSLQFLDPGAAALAGPVTILSDGTAMVEAVLAAGGAVPWRGQTSQAELVRVSRDGTTRREFITLRSKQDVSVAFNPPLQNNDTVIIHRSLYGKSLDVLNQVLVPLATVGNYWWLYRSFQQ